MSFTRYILFFVLLISSSITFSATNLGETNKTKAIVGFPPLMQSIGTLSNSNQHHLYDAENNPVTSVNDILYIPSINCQFMSNIVEGNNIPANKLPFFHFFDRDADYCLTDENNDIEWFMLAPKDESSNLVASWDDFNSTHITDRNTLIPPNEITESKFTSALRIPKEAVGKRIGFIYTPKSISGNPAIGQPIKVWDLGYFWGQSQYDEPGLPQQPNEGEKLAKINVPSGEGIVVNDFAIPNIDNLLMQGVFLSGERISAQFDFNPQTTNPYEDVSRLWWGKIGTTQANANFQNPNYSTSMQSPILADTDISEGYEVTVLPIKKEDGYFVVGHAVTITSDNPDNQFLSDPTITDLVFNNKLNIEQSIGATYQFDNGGHTDALDRSIYTWRIKDKDNQWQVLETNTISTSGIVPNSPQLRVEQAGLTLSLILEPRDQLGRIGQSVEVADQIESLVSIEVTPKSLSFNVAEQSVKTLTAEAIFSNGTQIDITQHENAHWSSDNPEVLVSKTGQVSLAPNNQLETFGIITFNYNGAFENIDVSVNAHPPSIEELAFSTPLSIGKQVEATYRFNAGGKRGATDQSAYYWNIKLPNGMFARDSNGTISQSGKVPGSPVLEENHSGAIVKLTVVPKDQNRTGVSSEIIANSEHIVDLVLEPNVLEFNIGDTKKSNLKPTATFSNGTVVELTPQSGVWTSEPPNVINVNNSGEVSISPNQLEPITGTVMFQYKGNNELATAQVNVNPLYITLQVIRNNALAGEEPNIAKAIVTDQNGNPVANKRVDFTVANESSTFFTITPSTGITDSQGEISTSLYRTYAIGGGVMELTAKISDTENSATATLNFLRLSGISRLYSQDRRLFYSGFPTTGYADAKFLIVASDNMPNSSFSWSSSDSSAASVDSDGFVTLKENSWNRTVDITARTDKEAHRYSFKVTSWFKKEDSRMSWTDLNGKCSSQIGMSIPTREQLSNGEGVRWVGSLWGEWGTLWETEFWTKSSDIPFNFYLVNLWTGKNTNTLSGFGNNLAGGICVKDVNN